MTEGGEGRYCKLQPGTCVENCQPSQELYVCSSVSARYLCTRGPGCPSPRVGPGPLEALLSVAISVVFS